MVERNEIDNAVGVIALQWLALHRDEVRKRWRYAGALCALLPTRYRPAGSERGDGARLI